MKKWLQIKLFNLFIAIDLVIHRSTYLLAMQENGFFLVDEKTRWKELYRFFHLRGN